MLVSSEKSISGFYNSKNDNMNIIKHFMPDHGRQDK